MKKKPKINLSNGKRSLPSLVEGFAKILRQKSKESDQNHHIHSCSSKNIIEQIAMILRKEAHLTLTNKPLRSQKKNRPSTENAKD
ncbi:MAG: hypothetical protein WCG14_00365 [Chlamydiia bacterium]